jgi:hypothetical protein
LQGGEGPKEEVDLDIRFLETEVEVFHALANTKDQIVKSRQAIPELRRGEIVPGERPSPSRGLVGVGLRVTGVARVTRLARGGTNSSGY